MADTMQRLSFKTKGKKSAPVVFDIDGEEFTCQPFVSGSVLMEHIARLTSADAHVASTELLRMWEDIFTTEEHARFRAYIDDPHNEVDIQDLGEILTGILERLSGRPTQPSSRSARGRSATGTTSKSGSNGEGSGSTA